MGFNSLEEFLLDDSFYGLDGRIVQNEVYKGRNLSGSEDPGQELLGFLREANIQCPESVTLPKVRIMQESDWDDYL